MLEADHDHAGHDAPLVVIAGAGPVGLWLASELVRGGVRVRLLERRPQRSGWSRALTVHPRTLEVLAMRGDVDRFLAEGHPVPSGHYAMLPTRLDFQSLDTPFPFALFLPQTRTERLLELIARRLGVSVEYGTEVTGVEQDNDATLVTLRHGDDRLERVEAAYVVGCDGRRSTVRAAADIPFVGTEGTITAIGVDARIDPSLLPSPADAHTTDGAIHVIKLDTTHYRVIVHDRTTLGVRAEAPLTEEDVRSSVRRILGHDLGLHDTQWLRRVGNATFHAARYRNRRVVLAGDAAHVHFPMGGQGLNLGVQDAANLGWKLAAVARGLAGDALLDSYEQERWPVAAAVIDDTLAQTAVSAALGREGDALRAFFAGTVLRDPALNNRLARRQSALAVSYPAPDGADPLVGQRVPDLALDDGSHLFSHLTSARFCLVGVGDEEVAAPVPLATVAARPTSDAADWQDVAALLVRPDGYLAWVGRRSTGSALTDAFAALSGWLPTQMPTVMPPSTAYTAPVT